MPLRHLSLLIFSLIFCGDLMGKDLSSKSQPLKTTKAAQIKPKLVQTVAAEPPSPTQKYLASLFKNISGPNNEFKPYHFDTQLIEKKHPQIFERLQVLRKKIQSTQEEHKEVCDLTSDLLKKEPEWVDAYWLAAGYLISFAEWHMRHQQKEEAIALFQKSEDLAHTCLVKHPKHPLCTFLNAGAMARLASIKGIATSLQKGRAIYESLLQVLDSKVNTRFQEHNPRSLQGAAHHGLGIFFRVVPQGWIVKFLLGYAGDINLSEVHHRRSIEIDGPVSSYVTELAVTLLCQNEKKPNSAKLKEADRLLSEVEKIQTDLPMDQFYARNAQKLRENLTTGCHFMFGSSAKPVSSEEIKKQMP